MHYNCMLYCIYCHAVAIHLISPAWRPRLTISALLLFASCAPPALGPCPTMAAPLVVSKLFHQHFLCLHARAGRWRRSWRLKSGNAPHLSGDVLRVSLCDPCARGTGCVCGFVRCLAIIYSCLVVCPTIPVCAITVASLCVKWQCVTVGAFGFCPAARCAPPCMCCSRWGCIFGVLYAASMLFMQDSACHILAACATRVYGTSTWSPGLSRFLCVQVVYMSAPSVGQKCVFPRRLGTLFYCKVHIH